MSLHSATPELRILAATLATQNGKAGTSPVKVAQEIFDFWSADESSPATSTKPATSGAKPKKVDAPDTGSDVEEQSSEKSATTEKAKAASTSKTTTSPSEDKGSGFAEDGSEVTIDQIRTAAVKFSAHPKGGEKKFVAKLQELGSNNLSGLDASRYGDLLAYLNGATAEAPEAETEDKAGPFD